MFDNKLLNRTTGTLLVGAALGYAASLFLSPDTKTKHRVNIERKAQELEKILTDPDERQRVIDIFEEKTSEATSTYREAKDRLIAFLAGVRGGIQDIDKQKYIYAIDKVVTELKEKHELPKKQIDRLRSYLSDDYQKIKNNVALH